MVKARKARALGKDLLYFSGIIITRMLLGLGSGSGRLGTELHPPSFAVGGLRSMQFAPPAI